jgi:hypothetical protein
MSKSINLEHEEIVEIHANGMILTLTTEGPTRIAVRVESEDGGEQIGIKPHEEESQSVVFYRKDTKPVFHWVK